MTARAEELVLGSLEPSVFRPIAVDALARIRRRQGRAAEALADWKTVFEKFPYLLNAEERGRVATLLGR